jgi:hypothetical protein
MKKSILQPLEEFNAYTKEDIGRATGIPILSYPNCPSEDILQLQTDVLNVLEGRVDINTFPQEYRKKIKDYYKFSATPHQSNFPFTVRMTRSTMDLV